MSVAQAGTMGVQWLGAAQRTRRRERLSLALLFVGGFALRWLMSDGDFYGDEAWYFYLAEGFGRESSAQADHPLFHIANRPLFYALFHASTYGGLWSFRLAGCCVGACIPPLAFCCARALGASRFSAAAAALALCAHPVQLRYSANVFPDVLAACFALSACWAAARRSAAWTLLLSLSCVWSKESFIIVPFIATWLRLQVRDSLRVTRPDAWAWLTCGIPVAYLAAVTAISLSAGIRLQGWSTAPLTLDAARNMFVGPESWPWLVWLGLRREARILVLWLGLPLFYLGWVEVLGRGMEDWYAVGPVTLSLVAAALGLDALRAPERWRVRAARWIALSAALICLAYAPARGLLLLRERTAALAGRWPQPAPAPQVVAILNELRPKRVIVLDCFWAYRYSHLRGTARPGTSVWWQDPRDTRRIVNSARRADLIVVCREPGHEEVHAALKRHSATLLETKQWLVLKPTATQPTPRMAHKVRLPSEAD